MMISARRSKTHSAPRAEGPRIGHPPDPRHAASSVTSSRASSRPTSRRASRSRSPPRSIRARSSTRAAPRGCSATATCCSAAGHVPPGARHGAFVSDQGSPQGRPRRCASTARRLPDEVLDGRRRRSPASRAKTARAKRRGRGRRAGFRCNDGGGEIVTSHARRRFQACSAGSRSAYNRAARMIEAMEAAGLVGPLNTNGSRESMRRRARGRLTCAVCLRCSRRSGDAAPCAGSRADVPGRRSLRCPRPASQRIPWRASTLTLARSRHFRRSSCRSSRTSKATSRIARPARCRFAAEPFPLGLPRAYEQAIVADGRKLWLYDRTCNR